MIVDILVICTIFSVFLLDIYIGNNSILRTQQAIAFVSSFLAMYVFSISFDTDEALWKNMFKKIVKISTIVIIAVTVYGQMKVTLKLYYTDDMCNQQDMIVAQNIVENVDKLETENDKPVVVIGRKQVTLNSSCLSIDMFGVSNFVWDYSTANPTGATIRTLMYINATCGRGFYSGDDTQRQVAVNNSYDMPCYPKEGYVQEKDGIIIVKLSNIE